jgi:hypothetical protein
MSADTVLNKYQDTKEKVLRLFSRMTGEAIELVLLQSERTAHAVDPEPEWMTASQLARYWQLVNANGEPTTAVIIKWAWRCEDEHPLPHTYIGDLLCFHRADVDVWAQEEADRR